MNAVVIGCGRVGSNVAKGLAEEGWEVTVVDENEDALTRLGAWRGGFVVGHGMDVSVLERAGIPDADAAVVATDGDNTNLVIGQVLQKRYGIGTVVVRVLDREAGGDRDGGKAGEVPHRAEHPGIGIAGVVGGRIASGADEDVDLAEQLAQLADEAAAELLGALVGNGGQ